MVRAFYSTLFYGEGDVRRAARSGRAAFAGDPPLIAKIVDFIRAGQAAADAWRVQARRHAGDESTDEPCRRPCRVGVSGRAPLALDLRRRQPAVRGRGFAGRRAAGAVVLFPLAGLRRSGTACRALSRITGSALGQIGRFLRLARAEGCRDLVLHRHAGAAVALREIRLDLGDAAAAAAGAARRFAAATIICCRASAAASRSDGFRLLGAHEVAPEILVPAGRLTAYAAVGARPRPTSRWGSTMLRGARPVRRRPGGGRGRRPCASRSKRPKAPTRCWRASRDLRASGRVRAPGRHRRAGEGAEDRPGSRASICRRSARRRRRRGRAPGLPASPSSPATPSSPSRSALIDGRRHGRHFRDRSSRGACRARPRRRRAASIFLIAGEESGDRLGAPLMHALRHAARRRGRASPASAAAQMAARGLAEPVSDRRSCRSSASPPIPQRLPMILRRIRADGRRGDRGARRTCWSSSTAPISPIASRGACARALPAIPIVDYVSPSVWAWRPGRARAMRAYVDHVLALLPFEPEAYRAAGGPPCSYVGHPLIEQIGSSAPERRGAPRRATPSRRCCWCCRAAAAAKSGGTARSFGERCRAGCASAVGPFELVVPTVPHLPSAGARARSRTGRCGRAIVVDERRSARRSASRARRSPSPAP